MNQTPLEAKIGDIITKTAAAIATAVREETSALVMRVAGRSYSAKAPAATVRATIARTAAKPRGDAGKKRHVPTHCIYTGCENPSKGPGWSFMCTKHQGTGKVEKRRLLAVWKAGHTKA